MGLDDSEDDSEMAMAQEALRDLAEVAVDVEVETRMVAVLEAMEARGDRDFCPIAQDFVNSTYRKIEVLRSLGCGDNAIEDAGMVLDAAEDQDAKKSAMEAYAVAVLVDAGTELQPEKIRALRTAVANVAECCPPSEDWMEELEDVVEEML